MSQVLNVSEGWIRCDVGLPAKIKGEFHSKYVAVVCDDRGITRWDKAAYNYETKAWFGDGFLNMVMGSNITHWADIEVPRSYTLGDYDKKMLIVAYNRTNHYFEYDDFNKDRAKSLIQIGLFKIGRIGSSKNSLYLTPEGVEAGKLALCAKIIEQVRLADPEDLIDRWDFIKE